MINDMRENLKKADWSYWFVMTVALVSAHFLTGIVNDEIPEIPGWYTSAAYVGVVLTTIIVFWVLRVLGLAAYQIVKNAMAAGGGVP